VSIALSRSGAADEHLEAIIRKILRESSTSGGLVAGVGSLKQETIEM
jgi:hypothetical protein